MTDRVMQEVQRMQKDVPSEDLVNRAKETAMREQETGMRQNGYWLSRLQAAKLLDRDPIEHMLGREERIKSVMDKAGGAQAIGAFDTLIQPLGLCRQNTHAAIRAIDMKPQIFRRAHICNPIQWINRPGIDRSRAGCHTHRI